MEFGSTRHFASLQLLEMELCQVAKLAGVGRCKISQAKQFLRSSGAAHLASRLSRLSKVRNLNAHPDVSLLDDVAKAAVGSFSGSGYDSGILVAVVLVVPV